MAQTAIFMNQSNGPATIVEQSNASFQVGDPQRLEYSISSSSSSGGESNRRLSKVKFDDQITTISYEFDTAMRKHYWYRKTDYQRFQLEKKETLRHFRHAQAKFQRIQEDIFCLRGFEACLSARAVQQRLLRRVAALQAVLETQFDIQNQRSTENQNSVRCPQERIQSRYHRVTISSYKQALQRAALDAAEVLEDQHDNSSNNNKNDDDQSTTTTSTSSSDSSIESSSSAKEDKKILYLKNQIDRVLHIKAEGSVRRTSLRSASSGPLMLRKSTANTA